MGSFNYKDLEDLFKNGSGSELEEYRDNLEVSLKETTMIDSQKVETKAEIKRANEELEKRKQK